MKLLNFDIQFIQSCKDFKLIGFDSYGNDVYVYHDLAFVVLNSSGEIIPYVFETVKGDKK